MKKTVLTFGLLIVALLLLFRLSRFSYLEGNLTMEILIAIFSITFFGLGVFLNRRRNRQAHTIAGADKEQLSPEAVLELSNELGISKREFEVLEQMAQGKSNQEIAESLFISESTVKTHVSNLLMKLESKRRTQAILKAREIGIVS